MRMIRCIHQTPFLTILKQATPVDTSFGIWRLFSEQIVVRTGPMPGLPRFKAKQAGLLLAYWVFVLFSRFYPQRVGAKICPPGLDQVCDCPDKVLVRWTGKVCVSRSWRGETTERGYQGYAEYFGIYSQDTRKVYLIHVDECPVGETNLRLTPTGKQGKNMYSAGVRWAKDYEIELLP